jgi:hypothetical protein
MPFWSRKKKPHSETIDALKEIRKVLESGTVSIESDTWRMMANQHILNCIMDDIKHERISSEDALNRLLSSFHRDHAGKGYNLPVFLPFLWSIL